MIGTGVFTTLGFQVEAVPSAFPVLMLWLVGGAVALAGALTYGELGAAFPRSGGEYALLRRTFHPAAGFAAGFISATVGFGAPTALAAYALATYLRALWPGIEPTHFAAAVVALFTAAHSLPLRWGTGLNDLLTAAKILLVAGFCALGFFAAGAGAPLLPRPGDFGRLTSPGFAVSLVFVSYAYTGWNAAAYIVGDLRRPERLARALVAGTLLVTALYLLVNLVILRAVPLEELAGRIEVGYLAADRILGPFGGRVMAGLIALVLASTVSSMVFLGPRVVRAMGEDERFLRPLGRSGPSGIPRRALLFQGALTLVFLYSGAFEQVLLYAGFSLNLMTALTVAGVFRLRGGLFGRRPTLAPDNPAARFRAPFYPWTPLFFLAMSAWALGYTLLEQPVESAFGLATAGLGILLYLLFARRPPRSPSGHRRGRGSRTRLRPEARRSSPDRSPPGEQGASHPA